MSKYFIWIGYTETFQLFSTSHLIAISTLIVSYMILFFCSKLIRSNTNFERFLRYFIGSSLILQEIVLNIYRVQSGSWSFAESLPFHLCSFSVILGSILLFKKSQFLFDILYFWSAGALMAILTPDLTNTDFPTFRFYQFFLSHGLILMSVLYMMFVNQFKPSKNAFRKTILFTLSITPFIAVINFFTGGNYFFIAYTPPTASIIDALGPWPFYLVPLSLVTFGIFYLMFIPFKISYSKKTS